MYMESVLHVLNTTMNFKSKERVIRWRNDIKSQKIDIRPYIGIYCLENLSLSCFATFSFQPYVNAFANPISWAVTCINCITVLE